MNEGGSGVEQRKSSGIFMKVCLVIAALWLLGVAVVVIYFHAIERPLDPMVVAFLFSPGIGELGFSSLIKAVKERVGSQSAENEIAELRAELEAIKPKQSRRASATTSDADTDKATAAPRELKQVRTMLEQMLPSLVTEAEKAYGTGAGSVKLSYVLEKVYARLPDACKLFCTPDQLSSMVDKALAIARELWLRNPSLIATP